ncbi:MAG: hypothetical protein WKG07_22220 [Hymenobacter sp.]
MLLDFSNTCCTVMRPLACESVFTAPPMSIRPGAGVHHVVEL